MWLAGLRGAMAYALALKCTKDLEIGPVILIDTLIYAFITILGVGTILNPILNKLGVKRKEVIDDGGVGLEIGNDDLQAGFAKRMKAKLSTFNARVIAPIFINMQSNESDVPRASDIFAELPVTENWAESMNGRNSSLIGQQPMPMSERHDSQDSSNIQMEMKPLDNKK